GGGEIATQVRRDARDVHDPGAADDVLPEVLRGAGVVTGDRRPAGEIEAGALVPAERVAAGVLQGLRATGAGEERAARRRGVAATGESEVSGSSTRDPQYRARGGGSVD